MLPNALVLLSVGGVVARKCHSVMLLQLEKQDEPIIVMLAGSVSDVLNP